MRKFNREPKIQINSVPGDKTKIKYTFQVSGELDWNSDFARRSEHDETLIDSWHFKHAKSFKQGLVDWLASMIQEQLGYEKCVLVGYDVPTEVADAYKKYKDVFDEKDKQSKQKAIAEAEANLARLKAAI